MIKCFIYKGECNVCEHHTCIEVFKIKAGLGYRQTDSSYYIVVSYVATYVILERVSNFNMVYQNWMCKLLLWLQHDK